jgi:uncharacterized protein (TIGR02246 family)
MRTKTLGLVVALTTLGLASVAAADDADVLREARDRAEIEALMWRYARALDTGNAEAYAATYTEDGQFGTGANATKGREALKAMVGGTGAAPAGGAPRPQLYHMTANHYIEFIDADHARIHAYYITAAGASGTGGAGGAGGEQTAPRVVAVGRSIDTLVRTSDGWRIQIRDVQPQN